MSKDSENKKSCGARDAFDLPDIFDLELPEASDFVSHPPKMSYQEMMRLCERMLPEWNQLRKKNPPPKFKGPAFEFVD